MAQGGEEMPGIKKGFASRAVRWGVGVPAALALTLYIASYFLDEPLRRITEQKMNQALKGYTVRLPELHLRLIGLSLTLKGLTVLQQAHPDPPVAHFPYLKASVHWREILFGRLVAEFELERPELNINLLQLRTEKASKVKLKERGWQQAAEAIYPLKINRVQVSDAKITYIDQDPKRPLVLSRLNFEASNIRNIHLPDNTYPSSFHLDTAIFGTGHGSIDGKANFLAEPMPGVKARFKLEKVPLDYFKPVFARYNLSITGGVLQASGDTEYAPKVKIAHLERLNIHGMKADYIHSPRTAVVEKKRAAAVGKAAQELSNQPKVLLRADKLSLTGCTLGMVNESPKYRVFLSDTDFHLTNFSNQFSQGTAQARLKARFMGNGLATASAHFRPERKGPDLDLYLQIKDTQMTTMNELLRAYGNFDVSAGVFSLVTELHVKDRAISGYIKPFFKEMDVYDRRRDKEQGVLHQVYEMLVGGVANLLENRPRDTVATKADITGMVDNPETSTWQIIVQLIRNAFFKAILPTFEKEAAGAGKR